MNIERTAYYPLLASEEGNLMFEKADFNSWGEGVYGGRKSGVDGLET